MIAVTIATKWSITCSGDGDCGMCNDGDNDVYDNGVDGFWIA